MRITKTSDITMLFMRFAIDAVFIDRSGKVVRAAADLRPWVPWIRGRGAVEVVEFATGTIGGSGTQVGDDLVFEDGS